MVRGGSAKVEDDGTSSSGQAPSETKQTKRRCVQSACVPCRKRKSKCDGGTPVCATCTAVYKTDCYYDAESESRRSKLTTATAQKRDNPTAFDPSDDAEFLIKSIRTLPEEDWLELVQRIRKDQRLDVAGLADTWRKTVNFPFNTASDHASLESDLSILLGKPSVTQTGESRHFGHSSGLGLVPEDENYTRSRAYPPIAERKSGTWTNVTDDIHFVENLLELYFTWSHPFYVVFSREGFYKDFRSGRQKYCSPLLVNAILAYACHFTDDPRGRTESDNFRTAGDHFFAEARKLLFEDESPSLTTTQALCVMAMREPSAGRDSSGFMYIGRCMRMAVELGLHLNTSAGALNLTSSEIEIRKVTFWGCFVVDTVWSICIGRIAQLPRAAITLDKPILVEPTFDGQAGSYGQMLQVTSRMFLQEFSSLCELVNDNNYMFFAPKERLTSRRLLESYEKYQEWYRRLPVPLQLSQDNIVNPPQPHIIVLHMLYHTVILHLFRPFLKVDLIHSDIRPRDICIEEANKVSALLRLYRRFYDLRACQLVLTHILLSVNIVHLLYSQDFTASSTNLVDGLQALEDISICHYFGARSFKIVHALAQTWNLPWPEAHKLSKLVPNDQGNLLSPTNDTFFLTPATTATRELSAETHSPLPPAAQGSRRESLSMFAPEYRTMSLPSHPSISQGTALVSQQMPTQGPTVSLPFSSNSIPSSTGTAPPSTSEHAEALFWSPMPGVGVPILPRNYQMSPMDLNNMLGNVNEWDRLGRDGFKMSDTWGQESMGFAGSNVHEQPNFPSQGQNLQQPVPGYDPWWGGGNTGHGSGVG